MEKSEKLQEVSVKMDNSESNNTMIWSQPIKIESTMVQSKNEVFTNIFKSKKSTDKQKSKDEIDTLNAKTEEVKLSNTKGNNQQKEMNSVKESATIQTDNTPAPPFKIQMSDKKTAKKQETSTVTTANEATKKTENTKTVEATSTNNAQNLWKQKEQEQKVVRFAGDPLPSDNQRAFPFAGWPNRNNRTARF
ncbi:hypothetical protein [Bacillus sp. X1(2014)]|uniref:hypothetical protein n=1 Tax=Bacillus sp. X1(2014) TaxID=1565991 RepID=UPI0011AAF8F9|nr:hypothetical protein [Bacillus sp. X1(2014)]